MKKLFKHLKRRKYSFIITPIIAIALIVIAITGYKRAFASMTYNLLTDNNGITWQYGYDPSTQVLEVAFYNTTGSPQTITVPNKSYFINNGTGITNGVTTYKMVNYENHGFSSPSTFNSTVNILDLTTVDVVDGVNPIVTTTIETQIILNPNGTEIGYDVFRNRKIDITNLNKVTKIAGGAFYNATFKDPSIKLPELTELGAGSFENSNIIHLQVNSPIIGTSAFKNCTSLATVKFGNDVLTLNAAAFEGDINLEKVDFNNVTTLNNEVFKNCTSFNQEIKDTKITSIGAAAFWGTTGFTKPITIPNGVTYIAWKAFYGSNIKKINLNNVTTIESEAFENCQELIDINFGKVESINWKAFYGNKKLESLILSNTVKNIRASAFEDCNLSNINFGKVEYIDFRAFASNNLSEIYLPKSITSLSSSHIFTDNPLEKVTIAYDTVKASSSYNADLWVILGDSFDEVKTVELVAPYQEGDTIPTRTLGTVSGEGLTGEIIAHDTASEYGNANSYKNVLQTRYLWNIPALENVIIGEGYEFIGGEQFTLSPNLKKVILPKTLKGIGCKAFENALILDDSEINLPQSLEYIGAQAFFKSFNLKNNIDLRNLKYIGKNAFKYSGITGIAYRNKLQYIGVGTANFVNNLKNITLDCDFYNTEINHIESNNFSFRALFAIDHQYETITLTNKVQTTPNANGIFYQLQADTLDMENCGINNNENYSLSSVFHEAKLKTIKLPKNLKNIGTAWFYRARIENPFELPNTIKNIGYSAFMGAQVTITNNLPNQLETIGTSAFYDCMFNEDIVIPSTVTSIGASAFAKWNSYNNTDSIPTPTNQLIYRHSVTILCDLKTALANSSQRVMELFANNVIDEMIFGNNVTELPTYQRNNNLTPQDASPEFYRFPVKKVTFKNLEIVPIDAFMYCNQLEEVDFSNDTSLILIDKNAFYNTPALKKVKLPKNINFTIESHAFSFSGLETIGDDNSSLDVRNNTVTIAGECAFQNSPYLTKVELNNKFNGGIIPNGTFADCVNLKTIILDDSIQEIQQAAFTRDLINEWPYQSNGSYISINDNNYNNNSNLGTSYSSYIGVREDYAFVTYGNPTINEPSYQMSLSFTATGPFIISNNKGNNSVCSITVTKNHSGTTTTNTYTSSNFSSNNKIGKYGMSYSADSGDTITISISDSNYYITKQDNVVWIMSRNNKKTIDSIFDMFCYQSSNNCQTYQNNHSSDNMKLYYLDEVVHIDTNKKNVEMNGTNTDIDKTGLILYALRRDGVLLVSNENGRYKEAVKYANSDITLPSYNPTNVDNSRRVFNTNKSISSLNVTNSENFENVTYHMGDEDPESGRIYVSIEYPNVVGSNSVVTNILKTKGNYADVVYSDGCGGESFGLYTYNDILLGNVTPQFEGTPVRAGYEFIGWDKEISDTATGDVVYVAQWKKIEDPVTPEDPNDPKPIDPGITNPLTGRSILLLIPLIVIIFGCSIVKKKREKRNNIIRV